MPCRSAYLSLTLWDDVHDGVNTFLGEKTLDVYNIHRVPKVSHQLMVVTSSHLNPIFTVFFHRRNEC